MSDAKPSGDHNSGDHGSDHSHDGHANATYRDYTIGFLLSVVLTVIPFSIVLGDLTENVVLAVGLIFAMGAIQMVVHIYYFLHVGFQVEDGWQAMALAMTVLLVVILLAGSIWVMTHLHDNMMPSHEQIERVRDLR